MRKKSRVTETAPADRKRYCNANNKNCSKCKYKYKASDPRGLKAVCPECGHPRPCGNPKMENGKCELHGGKSPAGISHPRFTTGVNSKYLPENLLKIVEDLAAKEDLLSNLEEIEALYARYLSLLQDGAGVNFYLELNKAWIAYEKAEALSESNGARQGLMKAALNDVSSLIKGAKGEATKWQEIYQILDQLVRLRDAEQRKIESDREMMPADRVMLLVNTLSLSMRARILEICDEHTARKLLAAVSSDVLAVSGSTNGRKLIAGTAAKR